MSDDPEQPAQQPLDYANPRHAELPPSKLIQQGIIGWLGAVMVIGITAFAAGYVGFALGYANQDHPAAGVLAVIGIGLAGVGAVVAAALRVRRDPRRRGLHAGLWIGLGCGLLMAGLCFKAL